MQQSRIEIRLMILSHSITSRARCDSSHETPLLDEVGLATVAQCMLRRLGKPQALKYLSIPHQIFASSGEEWYRM
jgi:hypothetical protein